MQHLRLAPLPLDAALASLPAGRHVLFVGDPHFKKDNVCQTERYVEETLRVFRGCPAGTLCLVAGDVLDTHGVLHLGPLRRAVDFVERLVAIGPTAVLVGNHDLINNQEYLSDQHWMAPVLEPLARHTPGLTVVARPVMRDGLVFAPYVPPGRLVEALDSTLGPDVWRAARCVFAHQEVRGAMPCGGLASDRGDAWLPEYPPLVSGHIHHAVRVGDNVLYPGSVISHSFGHSGESAVHLLTVDDSGSPRAALPVVVSVAISVPRRRTETVALAEFLADAEAFWARVRPRDALERVRVRLLLPSASSTTDPRYKALLKAVPAGVKITPQVDPETARQAAERAALAGGVRGFAGLAEHLEATSRARGDDVLAYVRGLLSEL